MADDFKIVVRQSGVAKTLDELQERISGEMGTCQTCFALVLKPYFEDHEAWHTEQR